MFLKVNDFGNFFLSPQKILLFHLKVGTIIHKIYSEIWNRPAEKHCKSSVYKHGHQLELQYFHR